MTYCYCHISAEDLAANLLIRASHSIRTTARQLGLAPSTISRGLAGYTVRPDKRYGALLPGTEPDGRVACLAAVPSCIPIASGSSR